MKNFTLIFTFFLLCLGSRSSFSQCDNLSFSSQAELDAFQPCTIVTGDVNISGPDITDLSALSSIEIIEGNLVLVGNDNLTSIAGISSLVSIGNAFVVQQNPQLQNYDGMENLLSCQVFICSDNEMVENFDAVQNISGDMDYVEVYNCPALNSIDGLQNIESVLTGVFLYNLAITDLYGLANLQEVGQSLSLIGLNLITDLSGLESLTTIGEYLGIIENELLENLNGLTNLEAVLNIGLYENPLLNDCCGVLPILQNDLTFNEFTSVNNGTDCSSIENIFTACGVPLDVDLELSIEAPNFENTLYEPGEWVSFYINVTNTSVLDATDVVVSVPYLSNAGYAGAYIVEGSDDITISRTESVDNFYIPSLAAGETVEVGVSYWAPLDFSTLTLYAEITESGIPDADSTPGNGDGENANEDDEAVLSIEPVIYSGLPDLVVSPYSDYGHYGNFYKGTNSPVRLGIVNVGSNICFEASGKSYFSNDDVLDTSDVLIAEYDISLLGVGAQYDADFEVFFPVETPPGTYYVISVIDPENEQAESNEDNNVLAHSVQVLEPTPETTADLEMEMSVNVSQFSIYEHVACTLSITNNSDFYVGNVDVYFPVPDGTVFVSQSDYNYYQHWISSWIVYLSPGETETLEVVFFTMTDDAPINIFAEIKSCPYFDIDSTPGNAVNQTATEDDEASVIITPYGYQLRSNENTLLENETVTGIYNNKITKPTVEVYPNPVTDFATVKWGSNVTAPCTIQLFDITGKLVLSQKEQTVKGMNEQRLDLSSLPGGLYKLLLQTPEGKHAVQTIVVAEN